jgi:hypothetical protein
MYALLATLLFLFTQEVTSLHVHHKLAVRSAKAASATGTVTDSSGTTTGTTTKTEDDKTIPYAAMAIGGALLVGAVGWYFYSGIGMVVYSLAGCGVVAAGVGIYLYTNSTSSNTDTVKATTDKASSDASTTAAK